MKNILILSLLLSSQLICKAADLVITTNTTYTNQTLNISGNLIIQNATVTFTGCTINMNLTFDQQYNVQINGNSNVTLDSTLLRGVGFQTDMKVKAAGGFSPTVTLKRKSKCTLHAGFGFFDQSIVNVINSDIEEIQAHDNANITINNSKAYLVLFFPAGNFTLSNLLNGTSITNTISITSGWNVQLTSANINGYQYDLNQGTTLSLNNCLAGVLSIHTPGTLPKKVSVSGLTFPGTTSSGSVTSLGPIFNYTNSEISLFNIYVFGKDTVEIKNTIVNELEAHDSSILMLGDPVSSNTQCYFNLLQTDVKAQILMNNVVVRNDGNGAFPSALTSDSSYLQLKNMNLTNLVITGQHNSSVCLIGCTNLNPSKIIFTEKASQKCKNITSLIQRSFSQNYKLYPNPASDFFNVDFTSVNREIIKMQVFNNLGELILEQEIPDLNNHLVIDGSLMEKGLYNIRFIGTQTNEMAKLLIIK